MNLLVWALVVLFLIAAVLRVWILFVALWFLVALLLLLRFGTRRVAHRLQVERSLPERVFAGDTLALDLTIHNGSHLPMPYLEVSEPAPFDLAGGPTLRQVISLGPSQTANLHLDIVCQRRGYHRLDPATGATSDVLGLNRLVLHWDAGRRVIVYPRIVPLARLGLPSYSALATLPAPTRFQEDPSRVVGVRPYAPGDALQRIHWTASARNGELVVKQLQRAMARETLICLDLDSRDYGVQWRQATEQAIVVAASLANHIILREKLPAGLVTEAWDPLAGALVRCDVWPRSGRSQMVEILERLARFRVDRNARFSALLVEASVRLAWGSTMLIVTGEIDEHLAAVLPLLSRHGHAVTVILIQPAGLVQSPAIPARILVHRIWDDTDLGVLA